MVTEESNKLRTFLRIKNRILLKSELWTLLLLSVVECNVKFNNNKINKIQNKLYGNSCLKLGQERLNQLEVKYINLNKSHLGHERHTD